MPLEGDIILDLSRMDRVLELDEDTMTVTVEPGMLLQDLQAQVKSPEQIHRPSPSLMDADARFIRSITITNNPYVAQDMAILYGRDDQGQRAIARELAFVIEDANRHGKPLPKELAEFAVASGFAEYDDQKDVSEKEKVIDLSDYRH